MKTKRRNVKARGEIKLRKYKKKTYRHKIQRGGTKLNLPTSGLSFEIIYNDFFREIYPRYIYDDYNEETLEEIKQENRLIKSKIDNYVKGINIFNGIPIYINDSIDNDMFSDEIYNKGDDNLCNEKLDPGKLISRFQDGGSGFIGILLRFESTIIGAAIIKIRHIPPFYKFGNLKSKNLYMIIDWLCGSKYKYAGKHIMDLLKTLQVVLGTESIYLISYDSAIPFYEKMGMKFMGLTEFHTPLMEYKKNQ